MAEDEASEPEWVQVDLRELGASDIDHLILLRFPQSAGNGRAGASIYGRLAAVRRDGKGHEATGVWIYLADGPELPPFLFGSTSYERDNPVVYVMH